LEHTLLAHTKTQLLKQMSMTPTATHTTARTNNQPYHYTNAYHHYTAHTNTKPTTIHSAFHYTKRYPIHSDTNIQLIQYAITILLQPIHKIKSVISILGKLFEQKD
jgi:hypothetical protein